MLTEKVFAQLKSVIDPELGINIVDLGLVYDVEIDEQSNVTVTMTLTTPGCPLHDSITTGAKYAIEKIDEINKVEVHIVWTPAWSPDRMNDEARRTLQGL